MDGGKGRTTEKIEERKADINNNKKKKQKKKN